MSNRDRELLKSAKITITQAAELLGLSRQSIHDGIRKSDHYLNEARLGQIYLALMRSGVPDNRLKAESLLASAEDTGLNIAQHGEEDRDYFCIFTRLPLELQDPTYLSQTMIKKVYPRVQIVAYFVGSASIGDRLHQAILRKRKDCEDPWTADIYIFEASLVQYLPHLAIYRNENGSWEGQIFSFGGSGKPSYSFDILPIDKEYIMTLKLMLEDVGFRLDLDDKPENFLVTTPVNLGDNSFKVLHLIRRGDDV